MFLFPWFVHIIIRIIVITGITIITTTGFDFICIFNNREQITQLFIVYFQERHFHRIFHLSAHATIITIHCARTTFLQSFEDHVNRSWYYTSIYALWWRGIFRFCIRLCLFAVISFHCVRLTCASLAVSEDCTVVACTHARKHTRTNTRTHAHTHTQIQNIERI